MDMAITNADDGNLEGMSERSIARAIGWEGDPGVLVKALQDSHYLDGMQIHDWYDYAGKLLDARKKKSAMEVARQKAVKDAKDARDQKKAGEQLVGKLPASGEPVAGDLPSGDQGEGEGDPGKLPASDDPEVQVETPFGPVIVSRFTRVQNAYVEHVGGFPSPDMDEQLHFYYEKMGPAVVCEGIRRSVDAHPANVRSYMLKVLKAWLEAGVVDMEGVQRVTKKRDDEISRRKEAAKKFSEPKVPEEKPAKINWGDEG
jgi:hypothetical protein